MLAGRLGIREGADMFQGPLKVREQELVLKGACLEA